MTPTKGMRAEVSMERWSGHGEGGVLALIKIVNRPRPEDTYSSTPNDIEQSKIDAEYISKALEFYDSHG